MTYKPTPKDISELRARTGAGIGDCKNALEEAGGDISKAAELLRTKGIAKAEKRAGRSASQGLVVIEIAADGKSGGMIELPVANGPGFVRTSPSGLPRSHARLSKSPKTWQLAHAESPWLELNVAS